MAWFPWTRQRPWPITQETHHCCIVVSALQRRGIDCRWMSRVVSFLCESPLVVACNDYYLRVFDRFSNSMLQEARYAESSDNVYHQKFNKSGNAIAVAYRQGRLRVLVGQVNGPLKQSVNFKLGDDDLDELAFQSNGSKMAASPEFGPVYILDLAEGALIRSLLLPRMRAGITGVTWTSSGEVVAVGTEDYILLYSPATGQHLRTLMHDFFTIDSIYCLEFSPVHSNVLAVGCWCEVRILDAQVTQSTLARVDTGDCASARNLVWLPKGDGFVVEVWPYVSEHFFLHVIDANNDNESWHCIVRFVLSLPMEACSIAVDIVGKSIVVAYRGLLLIVDAHVGAEIARHSLDDTYRVNDVAFLDVCCLVATTT